MLPMLATSADRPPTGPQWRHEVKWDGMRILADVRRGRLKLSTRSGADATDRFPELATLAGQYDDMLLDGEVVVLDGGVPSFAALSDRIHVRDRATATAIASSRPATYIVFDILRLFGTDLTARPWAERRRLLEQLDLHGPTWQVPESFDDGQALFDATREQGLEGIVSKNIDSPYTQGRRGGGWVKVPHRPTISVIVGGWRPEAGSTSRVGALLVGEEVDGRLRYLGRVGSGLAGRIQLLLYGQLRARDSERSPFDEEIPREDAVGALWMRPDLVVDVRSLGRSAHGRLRQPSFHVMRPDLTPADLREHPGGAGLEDGTPL